MVNKDSSFPAYMQIRQYVISQIARNGNPNEKLLSVRDLAKMYNVSPPTAMKALRQLIDEGVIVSRSGVGTFINPDSSLCGRYAGTKCVGLIVSNGLLVHYDRAHMKILSGIYDVLSETNITTQLINSGNRGEALKKEIATLKLDGVLWAHSGLSDIPSPEELENSDERMININFHRKSAATCTVFTDFTHEGRRMAEYLLTLGHDRVIWALEDPFPYPEIKREMLIEGIKAAYQERGVELDNRLFLSHDKPDTRLETIIDLGVPFSAIATAAEYYPMLLEVTKRKGLRVPEDISIITEDDNLTCHLTNPIPTRLARPLRKLGETAARAMIDLINSDISPPFDIALDWQILSGETCAVKKQK